MNVKEEYQKKLQKQLDEWTVEIDKLKILADKAKSGLKTEYQKEVLDLKTKREAAQEKLDELKRESGEAWEDLKTGVETAWDVLGNAVKTATSRFK